MKKNKSVGRPLLIGITGGIGSGKSTVCRVFEWLKIPVYNADDAAKYLIQNDQAIKSAIIDLLGTRSYDKNGAYNRKYVANKVFKDKELLTKLNRIVHPAVAQHFKDWSDANQSQHYLLKEAAILFESGAYKDCDKIICVIAPKSLRINRVIRRNGMKKNAVIERIDNQMSDQEKIKKSDFIINNDEEQLLIPQVMAVHEAILGLKIRT